MAPAPWVSATSPAYFALAIVGLLVGTVAALVLPLIIGGLVGQVVTAGGTGGLDQLVLAMGVLALVLAVASFLQTWSLGIIGERIVACLRAQLFERLVSLERLMRGRTTIVVAHRLSTIRHANRIAVVDDGWLLELGSHEELLARDGLYAHLWRLQASERPEPMAARGRRDRPAPWR